MSKLLISLLGLFLFLLIPAYAGPGQCVTGGADCPAGYQCSEYSGNGRYACLKVQPSATSVTGDNDIIIGGSTIYLLSSQNVNSICGSGTGYYKLYSGSTAPSPSCSGGSCSFSGWTSFGTSGTAIDYDSSSGVNLYPLKGIVLLCYDQGGSSYAWTRMWWNEGEFGPFAGLGTCTSENVNYCSAGQTCNTASGNFNTYVCQNPPPPATPTGLAVTSTSTNSISLSWNTVSGATSYKIQRDGSTLFTGITGTSYTNTGLTAGTTYSYRVLASNSAGDSPFSSPVSGTTQSALPTTPTGFSGTYQGRSAQGYNSVDLNWNVVSGATGYKIYRSISSGGTYSLVYTIATGSSTGIDDTSPNLQYSTTYYYKISATNSAGESPQSSFISVAIPAPPTLPSSTLSVVGTTTNSVSLSWTTVTDPDGAPVTYEVERCTDASLNFCAGKTDGGTYSSTSYTDTGLSSGTTYYYFVNANSPGGEPSSESNSVSTTTQTPQTCGNNIKEGTEICDGSDLSGESCTSRGYTSGLLSCQSDCSDYDVSQCSNPPAQTCGNNIREGSEICDGSDLDGKSCSTQGFASGTLTCSSSCSSFVTSSCSGGGGGGGGGTQQPPITTTPQPEPVAEPTPPPVNPLLILGGIAVVIYALSRRRGRR